MSLFRKNSLSRSMLIGSLILFFATSLFPIWLIWHINPWEGLGYEESLWLVLWELLQAKLRAPNPNFPTTVKVDADNFAIAIGALIVGALIGAIHYKFRRILARMSSTRPGNQNPGLN